jgi:hypothetical protein
MGSRYIALRVLLIFVVNFHRLLPTQSVWNLEMTGWKHYPTVEQTATMRLGWEMLLTRRRGGAKGGRMGLQVG